MRKMIFALMMLSIVGVSGCMTDELATRKTLDSAGYTDIRTTGYQWWECGEDDTYHTGFVAKNPNGKVVSGTVCCGLWAKGCTIRF